MPNPSQSAASNDGHSVITDASRNANDTATAPANDGSTANTDGLTTEELQKLSEQSSVSSAAKLFAVGGVGLALRYYTGS